MRRAYYVLAYWLSWILFALVGLLLNLACIPLLLLPRREVRGAAVRAVIRRLFDFWVRWMHASRVVQVTFDGFPAQMPTGTVYIANHPTLVDATFLLARLPDTVCIFKPQLMRNPTIGPAAIMARYVSGDAGVDVMRTAAARVAEGQSLLIFPEGTRTAQAQGEVLGTLKAGFALIASRAHAPVQLVIVRSTPGLAAKGRPWWRPPSTLPAFVSFTWDRRWEYVPDLHAADLKDAVELRLREVLAS
jgi:1-acyl-sn-glycerol-3-phosphate acyltransferase